MTTCPYSEISSIFVVWIQLSPLLATLTFRIFIDDTNLYVMCSYFLSIIDEYSERKSAKKGRKLNPHHED